MAPAGPPPGPGEPSGSARAILERLKRETDARGRVRFDRFVEAALYTPLVGYYERPGRRLGRRGDFYTAAHVHAIFGRTLARRAMAEWERQGRPSAFRIVELGPGDGRLALDLIRALAARLPSSTRLDYSFVERSAAFRQRLLEMFRGAELPTSVQAEAWASPGAGGVFDGVVVANEFFDAQPFRRFVSRRGSWHEIWVRLDEGEVETEELPSGSVPELPEAPAEDTYFEWMEAPRPILRAVGDHLCRGAMLILDYGDEERALLQRREGTAVGIQSHHPVRDLLAQAGDVDLSAFVNFTRLEQWARAGGLVPVGLRPQAEALGAWGVEAELAAFARPELPSTEVVEARLAVKNLLFGFPTFRVLELSPWDDAPSQGSSSVPGPD